MAAVLEISRYRILLLVLLFQGATRVFAADGLADLHRPPRLLREARRSIRRQGTIANDLSAVQAIAIHFGHNRIVKQRFAGVSVARVGIHLPDAEKGPGMYLVQPYCDALPVQ